MNETWCLRWHCIQHTACHRHRVVQTLFGKFLTGGMTSFLHIERIVVVVTADTRHVVHRRGYGSLDARVGSGSIQSDASPTADADDANLLSIHILLLRQEIDSSHKVLCVDVGRSRSTRFTTALTRIGRVESQRHETTLSHLHRIESTRLLLHGSKGTRNSNSRQLAFDIFRRVHISS